MNEKIPVTVVTVCFNAESVIERTMKSVLAQNYPYIEYIIVDGKSSDATCQLIKNMITHHDNVVFVSEKDSGIYDAMNKAVRKASGDYILFMNAGDAFVDGQVISNVIEHVQGEAVIYGNHFSVMGNKRRKNIPSEVNGRPIFCHQASLTQRKILMEYPFDTQYRILADRVLFDKLAQNGYSFKYVPVDIVYYDLHGVSTLELKKKQEDYLRMRQDKNLSVTLRTRFRQRIMIFRQGIANLIPESIRSYKYEKFEDPWTDS